MPLKVEPFSLPRLTGLTQLRVVLKQTSILEQDLPLIEFIQLDFMRQKLALNCEVNM